jgi:hypothetical protein
MKNFRRSIVPRAWSRSWFLFCCVGYEVSTVGMGVCFRSVQRAGGAWGGLGVGSVVRLGAMSALGPVVLGLLPWLVLWLLVLGFLAVGLGRRALGLVVVGFLVLGLLVLGLVALGLRPGSSWAIGPLAPGSLWSCLGYWLSLGSWPLRFWPLGSWPMGSWLLVLCS